MEKYFHQENTLPEPPRTYCELAHAHGRGTRNTLYYSFLNIMLYRADNVMCKYA